jgi:KDO2-lipid IV(A) lauroyltransferase
LKVLYWFVYYCLLIPLSLLPFWALQRISDLLYYIIYYLIGYRKKIVYQNLGNAFPDKSQSEIHQIARKFYRHLCDLIVESVKLFSISKEEVIARFKFVNPEVLDAFYDQHKSIIIVAGHYNNWEMFAQNCNLQMKHQAVGIYTPLTNPYFEKKFTASRGRYNVILLPKDRVKAYFAGHKEQLMAVIFGTDQSPSSSTRRVYWTNFLNQETAVMYGSEKYAREYNFPVIFARIKKIKRGWYNIEFELMEENPAAAEYGSITEKHTRALEKQILEQPEYWLWTHRRWKRKKSDFEH